jgi:hypothetical protein
MTESIINNVKEVGVGMESDFSAIPTIIYSPYMNQE